MRILELNLERPVRDDRARQSPGIACARSWCARRDSNPHVFRQQDLNLPRLPIPPRARGHPESARPIARIGRGASGSVSGCRSATACGRWRLIDEETNHRPAAATEGAARHADAAPARPAAARSSGNAAGAARYRHSPTGSAGHARTHSGTADGVDLIVIPAEAGIRLFSKPNSWTPDQVRGDENVSRRVSRAAAR